MRIVALRDRKPRLSITPEGSGSVLIELTDQQAINMAANLLYSVQLKREREDATRPTRRTHYRTCA